jgi:hypothetical protein
MNTSQWGVHESLWPGVLWQRRGIHHRIRRGVSTIIRSGPRIAILAAELGAPRRRSNDGGSSKARYRASERYRASKHHPGLPRGDVVRGNSGRPGGLWYPQQNG